MTTGVWAHLDTTHSLIVLGEITGWWKYKSLPSTRAVKYPIRSCWLDTILISGSRTLDVRHAEEHVLGSGYT